jgi:hypothetical protein
MKLQSDLVNAIKCFAYYVLLGIKNSVFYLLAYFCCVV